MEALIVKYIILTIFFYLNILLLQQQVATELSKTENKVYFTKIFVVTSYGNDLFAWGLHKPL